MNTKYIKKVFTLVTIEQALTSIKKVKKVSCSFRLDEDIKKALEEVSKIHKCSSAELLEAILKQTDLLEQYNKIKK
jgi:transcription elongation factor